MKTFSTRSRHPSTAGFTLVEVLISMTILVLTLSLAIGVFVFGLQIMYKDNQRLITNATLRYFVTQMSKETIDATEFYIFRTYEDLDGSVNMETNVTTDVTATPEGIELYHGDCLVLVTRTSTETTANIRQFRIYFRQVTNSNAEGRIRYWESAQLPVTGTGATASISTLLSNVNLKGNPAYVGTGNSARILAERARGRPKNVAKTEFYPIFSSEFPSITKTNESVAVNVEIINGTTINNLLSSSSFNYTISPRR